MESSSVLWMETSRFQLSYRTNLLWCKDKFDRSVTQSPWQCLRWESWRWSWVMSILTRRRDKVVGRKNERIYGVVFILGITIKTPLMSQVLIRKSNGKGPLWFWKMMDGNFSSFVRIWATWKTTRSRLMRWLATNKSPRCPLKFPSLRTRWVSWCWNLVHLMWGLSRWRALSTRSRKLKKVKMLLVQAAEDEPLQVTTIEIGPLMPEKVLVRGIKLAADSALRALRSAWVFYVQTHSIWSNLICWVFRLIFSRKRKATEQLWCNSHRSVGSTGQVALKNAGRTHLCPWHQPRGRTGVRNKRQGWLVSACWRVKKKWHIHATTLSWVF